MDISISNFHKGNLIGGSASKRYDGVNMSSNVELAFEARIWFRLF
jgi:hypothetical protein